MVILILLALPQNRTPLAWWVGAPLLGVFLIRSAIQPHIAFIPSQPLGVFCDVAQSLIFGITAVWLLAPHLKRGALVLISLKVGLTLAVFSFGSYWFENLGRETAGFVIVGVGSFVLTLGLCLSAFNCRRRFNPARLLGGLAFWMLTGCALTILPLAIPAILESRWDAVAAISLASLGFAAFCFTLVLPFLLLAFTNGFYRERLQELLRWNDANLPPVLSNRFSDLNERLSS